VLATLESGWLGYGPECRQLEQKFTQSRGGWALATSSCTSALYLAGRLVRSLSGESVTEVIVPAVSFVASGVAFAQAGVRPVIADTHVDNLLLDPRAVERVLTPRTRAVLVVHLYGQRSPDLRRLRALADAHGLLLIEDCAHRVDLLDNEGPVGDLLCYSFNAVKELPAGEGGILWGREVAHEPWVRSVSNLGLTVDTMERAATLRHADYAFVAEPGLKLRSNDLAAALVNAGLESLAECRAHRREQFLLYDRLLAPLAPAVCALHRGDDDSYLMYVVKVPAALRETMRATMAAAGVATSVHYPSLARHPLFGNKLPGGSCGDQDQSIVTLPTFPDLSEDGQRRVVATLTRALEAIPHAMGADIAAANRASLV
jgi:UDP-4-amino-4-deoxy-L-arabinose-oxoglutarate aminotransferase